MTTKQIRRMIDNREHTHNSIYSDIGTLLENVSTDDLIRFFIEDVMMGSDLLLRTFLEENVIAAEISKCKYGIN